ncbi:MULTISPECIES: hypothetical protein [Nonomuraea]|jgi:hypothetical protein|uniref:PqqD family protein n=1 Tax=Nonomuraea salmonea TaxID=46181 RepID=A0ABV5P3E2_9ACTN
MDIPAPGTPVVCDMSTASDTPRQRLDEYHELFGRHLIARERTAQGIRFRLRAEPGVAAWVRDLAAREKACCAFFAFDVTGTGEEVVWDCAVIDDETARAVLDEFYHLTDDLEGAMERLTAKGLWITPRTSTP